MSYAAVGGPNQVVSASGSPGSCLLSHPGDISVGPDQHGGGSGDRAKYRKLPRTDVFGVDQLDPIRPWRDVEAAGLAEVEQHRPGIVQQGEDPQRAVGGDQVEIGHAAPEQRVSLAEVVMNVQAGHHRGEPLARLVHAQRARTWCRARPRCARRGGGARSAPSCCAARGQRPGGARRGRCPGGFLAMSS